MKMSAVWPKASFMLMAALFFRTEMLPAQASSAISTKPSRCSAPEYRQFDFWIGDWYAFEADGGFKDARVQVDRILDGCVLRETYRGPDGHEGQSFSIYDASRKVWHQSWVTNRGELLTIEGNLKDDVMVLSGIDHRGGVETLVRGEWKPVTGGVRETAVTSSDGGKTWKPWFDLMFRPAATSQTRPRVPAKDEKVLAVPDTEYPAAVKKNNAAAK